MAALASLILTACGVSESSDAARTNYSAHTQPTSPPTVATMSSSLAKPQERNINITSWCTPLALNELECGESADGVQVVGRRLNRPPWAALNNSVSNVFDWIYKTQYWGSDGGGSGTGSSIQVAAGARRVIEHLVYRLKIRSMIDAPCGAMTWQAPMLQELKRRDPAFRYFGVDIVDSVVQRNAQQLSHLANVSFATMNLETDALPRGYDLILSRDAMQHNSFDTIKSMLQTFVATDARYLLFTSYPERVPKGTSGWAPGANANIKPGLFFRIDLAQQPFKLKPQEKHPENDVSKKVLYLYEREAMANAMRIGPGKIWNASVV